MLYLFAPNLNVVKNDFYSVTHNKVSYNLGLWQLTLYYFPFVSDDLNEAIRMLINEITLIIKIAILKNGAYLIKKL